MLDKLLAALFFIMLTLMTVIALTYLMQSYGVPSILQRWLSSILGVSLGVLLQQGR